MLCRLGRLSLTLTKSEITMKRLKIALFTIGILLAFPALAEIPFFGSLKVGTSFLDWEGLESNDLYLAIGVGVEIDPFLRIEIGYEDYGKISGVYREGFTSGSNVGLVEADGWYLVYVPRFQLSDNWTFEPTVGVVYTESFAGPTFHHSGTDQFSDKDWRFRFGVEVAYSIAENASIGIGYVELDIGRASVHALFASLKYEF
jgi:hypothetical protein